MWKNAWDTGSYFWIVSFKRFLDKQEDVQKIMDITKLQFKGIETDHSVFSKEADEIIGRIVLSENWKRSP